jgi:hypothetical protein
MDVLERGRVEEEEKGEEEGGVTQKKGGARGGARGGEGGSDARSRVVPQVVAEEHREGLMKVVISLLLPRLTSRRKTAGRKGRGKTPLRRTGILDFFGSVCTPRDLDFLVEICLEPFSGCLEASRKILGGGGGMEVEGERQPREIAEVTTRVPGKKQVGFLNLARELLKTLKQKLSGPSVDKLFEATLVLFFSASVVLGTTGGDQAVEEEDEEEGEGEEKEEGGEAGEEDKKEKEEEKEEEKGKEEGNEKEKKEKGGEDQLQGKRSLQTVRQLSLAELGAILVFFPEHVFSPWATKLMEISINSLVRHLTSIGRAQQERERAAQAQLREKQKKAAQAVKEEQQRREAEAQAQAGGEERGGERGGELGEGEGKKEGGEDEEGKQGPTHSVARVGGGGRGGPPMGSKQALACLNWFLAMTSNEVLAKKLSGEQGRSKREGEGERGREGRGREREGGRREGGRREERGGRRGGRREREG